MRGHDSAGSGGFGSQAVRCKDQWVQTSGWACIQAAQNGGMEDDSGGEEDEEDMSVDAEKEGFRLCVTGHLNLWSPGDREESTWSVFRKESK